MPIPADQIDPDACKVVRRLVRSEYQAYLVGGCVRDLLLGRTPKDFDIATSATPDEVRAEFRNCRIIGRRFRLAHIFFGQKIIETATFRSNPRELEGAEADEADDLLIRRDNVFGTAEEDARRRDFTINGLFYDLEADQVIDYVGGLHDLAGRVVRTIGDPDIRFREDPVRILRAIKFAARLGFTIEPTTWQAIRTHQGEIAKCATPRVLEEIYRLLRGGAARRSMELLRDTGVLAVLVPALASLLRERPNSPEAAWLWRILDRIDATKDRAPSNAVLLCALVAPFIGPELFEDGGRPSEAFPLIEERAQPVLAQLRATRRDVERVRQILVVQRRLAPSKRRRARLPALPRHDWFAEALHVCELVGLTARLDEAAREAAAAELDGWQRQLGDANEMQAAATGGEGEPRRRRRRRGGRRNRGKPEGYALEFDMGDPEDVPEEDPRASSEELRLGEPVSAKAD